MSESTVICQFCENEIDSSSTSCPHCGGVTLAQLSEELDAVVCPACRLPNISTNKRCIGCNRDLSDLTSQPEPNAIEPKHYTDLAISPLEYIEANEPEFSWAIANVIKYVSRYKRKNGLEDLEKATWYLNHQIEVERKKESENG